MGSIIKTTLSLNMMPTTFILITLLCALPPVPVSSKNLLKHIHKEIHAIHSFSGPGQCPIRSLSCKSSTNVIENPTQTSDFNQCGIRCGQNKRCQFWTMIPITPSDYDPKTQTTAGPISDCFLLLNCDSPIRGVIGVISGNKNCPPPK